MAIARIIVSFLVVLLACCFSTEAALTSREGQKIQKKATKLATKSQKKATQLRKTKKSDDDDDDDEDEDDEDEVDPQKAQLRKKLLENAKKQAAVKSTMKHLSDEQRSSLEIDAYANQVANETQSAAMGNMLGKMWKDMRMFEVPEYSEHLEDKLAALKREERSTEDALASAEKEKEKKAGELKTEEPENYGNEDCRCVGIDNLEGETIATVAEGKKESYPADLGARCEAWDLDNHPKCPGASWCKQQWCYVDPCKCKLGVAPKAATYIPGAKYQGKPVHFSYATCDAKDSYTAEEDKKTFKQIEKTCAVEVNHDKWGDEACPCVGVGPQPGTTKVFIKDKKVEYPADTGAMCNSWDADNHPDCQVDSPADWFSAAWFYVDPCNCKLPSPPKTSGYLPESSYQGKPVYYSYAACGAEDGYTSGSKEACVNQKKEGACQKLDKCAWDGKTCLGKELVSICAADAKKSSAFGLKGVTALLLPVVGLLF
jgi:hypothetical protein